LNPEWRVQEEEERDDGSLVYFAVVKVEEPGRDAAPISIRIGSTRRRQAKINDSYNQRV